MILYICENCGKEVEKSYGSNRFCSKSCATSFSSKKGDILIKRKAAANARSYKRSDTIGGTCKFCGKECKNQNSLKNHERCCKSNPNRPIFISVRSDKWYEAMKKRRGLPYCGKPHKMSEERKKEQSEKMKIRNPSFDPAVRKKISETQKRNYKNKSIWATQIEKRKSYAEQYFDKLFPELKQNYHVSRYFLDLANPEKKIYIEIDGEQHYNDPKVVEHDKIRTQELESLGWICLKRVRWSEFKKLEFEEKKNFIDSLKEKI